MALDKTGLSTRCYYAFSELFMALMHLKVMRAYIDGVLRFGIPPKFYMGVIKANKGKEKDIIKNLITQFADPNMKDMYGSKEEVGDQEDFYPFVLITLTSPTFLM